MKHFRPLAVMLMSALLAAGTAAAADGKFGADRHAAMGLTCEACHGPDKARAQANAKANAAKKAKQDKLDALALRERELKVRLAELKVQEREAQVGTSVAEEAVRTEKAREKVELELERTRAEIKKLDQ